MSWAQACALVGAGLIKHSQLGSVKLQSLLVCSTGRKRQPAAPAEEKQRGKTEEHASFRVEGVILQSFLGLWMLFLAR